MSQFANIQTAISILLGGIGIIGVLIGVGMFAREANKDKNIALLRGANIDLTADNERLKAKLEERERQYALVTDEKDKQIAQITKHNDVLLDIITNRPDIKELAVEINKMTAAVQAGYLRVATAVGENAGHGTESDTAKSAQTG